MTRGDPTRPLEMATHGASRAGAVAIASAFCALLAGCSLVNRIDACEKEPSEVRVNQRGDQSEFPNHPKAAVQLLGSNRVLVTYAAQPLGLETSEVRIALLDAATGERAVVCGSDFEYTLSDPNILSYAPSVAPVDMTVGGLDAKAAVSWIEGQLDTRVKVVESETQPGVQFAEHTSMGSRISSPGSNTWTVEWTAPSADTPVQFNIAANAANDDASALGDFIYSTEIRITPAK